MALTRFVGLYYSASSHAGERDMLFGRDPGAATRPDNGSGAAVPASAPAGTTVGGYMETASHPQTLVGADRPFFTTRESLDDIQSLSSVSFARGDLSIGRYRRDRPGHGISTPNPISPMVMAVVILRPRPAHVGWHDDRLVDVPALGAGALNCLDLREAWTMDLSEPF